jgi:hypothetical protein
MKSKKSTRKTAGTAAAPLHHRKSDTAAAAREHYRREKAARADRSEGDSDALAAARREYLALLEANAAKGRGGRPRKKPVPAKRADADLFEGESEESAEE